MLATDLRDGCQQNQALSSDIARPWGLQVVPCGKTSCSALLMAFSAFVLGLTFSRICEEMHSSLVVCCSSFGFTPETVSYQFLPMTSVLHVGFSFTSMRLMSQGAFGTPVSEVWGSLYKVQAKMVLLTWLLISASILWWGVFSPRPWSLKLSYSGCGENLYQSPW